MDNTASFYLANVGSIPAGRTINIHMNILILGDSWGIPNYFGPPGVDAKYHVEFLLKDLGHIVYNCANNGGSNLASFESANRLLKSLPIQVDLMIWFHTESLRDRNLFNHDEKFYIDEIIQNSCKIIYGEFEKRKQTTKSKTFVVGGQAKLVDSFYQITGADYVIPDWRSLIFNRPFPVVHTLCHLDLIEKSSDSLEFKNNLLKDHETILDYMKQSSCFPDACHPGILPHRELVERISALIV